MFSGDRSDIERKRLHSVAAMEVIEAEKWDAKYQEICDKAYWKNGPCCAGCDHWVSHAGMTGQCRAGEILSGDDVARSLGWTGYSWTPPPGYPHTDGAHQCGKFKDDFDWQSLDAEYLRKIGA